MNPGSSPALPGVQRTVGSVVHPGGSWPQIAIPGIPYRSIGGQNFNGQNFNRQNINRGVRSVGSSVYAYPVPYPVYVGGGYGGYYDEGAAAPVQQQGSSPT